MTKQPTLQRTAATVVGASSVLKLQFYPVACCTVHAKIAVLCMAGQMRHSSSAGAVSRILGLLNMLRKIGPQCTVRTLLLPSMDCCLVCRAFADVCCSGRVELIEATSIVLLNGGLVTSIRASFDHAEVHRLRRMAVLSPTSHPNVQSRVQRHFLPNTLTNSLARSTFLSRLSCLCFLAYM
jgi:hypothetical protein